MNRAAAGLLLVIALVGGAGGPVPPAGAPVAATPEPLLATGEGPALRVGPAGAAHAVGLLANGEGAIGIAVAADGAFLAFTCGTRPHAGAWYSGDWFRGRVAEGAPIEAAGGDGETLRLAADGDGRRTGRLRSPRGDEVPFSLAAAAPEDGLFRRDDADGVLGAVALPGNTVCAVKRTDDGRLIPAGTVPY